jgi:predicted Zn-dependent protease
MLMPPDLDEAEREELRRLAELARAASRAGDPAGEYRYGQELISKFRDHPAGWFHAARAARTAGRIDETEGILANAETRFSNDQGIISIWASLPRYRGNRPEAMRRAEWFRERFPELPGPHMHISRTLNFCGKPAEAKAAAEAALSRFPDDPGLRDALAEAEEAIRRGR